MEQTLPINLYFKSVDVFSPIIQLSQIKYKIYINESRKIQRFRLFVNWFSNSTFIMTMTVIISRLFKR